MSATEYLIIFTASLLLAALFISTIFPLLQSKISQTSSFSQQQLEGPLNVSIYRTFTYGGYTVIVFDGPTPKKILVDGLPQEFNMFERNGAKYCVIPERFSGAHEIVFIRSNAKKIFTTNISDAFYTRATVVNNAVVDLNDFQIRFTLDDCNALVVWNDKALPVYLEECNADGGIFWTRVPKIPANGVTFLKIFHGLPLPIYEYNGSKVFIFFDDFDDNSEWYTDNAVVLPAIDNGRTVAYIYSIDTSKNGYVNSKQTLSGLDNVVIEVLYRSDIGPTDMDLVWGIDDDNIGYPNWGAGPGDPTANQRHRVIVGETTAAQGSKYLLGEWRVHQVIRQGNTVASIYDGEYLSGSGSPLSSGHFHMSLDPDGGGRLEVDWIRIRKYVYPEPTVTLGTYVS